MSLRQRTSRQWSLQRGTPNSPCRGAQQGHCTVHYLPKGVIIQSPAEMERAGRGPQRGQDSWSSLLPVVSNFLLRYWWITTQTLVLQNFFWTACCSHQATWRPNKVSCSFLWSNQREIKDEYMWNVDKGLLFFPKVTWKNWQGLTLLFQKVLQSVASFAKNSYFSHYQSLISQILSWLNGHTVGCKKTLKQQTHCRITFPITTGVCLYCLLLISVCRVCIGSCFILQCNKEQKKDTLGDSN